MTVLNDATLAGCTTPREADIGSLIVLHGRPPHLLNENKAAESCYAYVFHLIDGIVATLMIIGATLC